MISNREKLRADFSKIFLIHNFDGFGLKGTKISMYNKHMKPTAEAIPFKGFKLFYPKPWKNEGFDVPLMTPTQVLNLTPKPIYINYQ